MIKYIDKGTTRQHLTDRLMESALNNVGIKADADEVFRDIAKNRLPVWIDELQTYDIQEVKHGRWENIYSDNYKCSVCGAWYRSDEPIDFVYCPNCGASMNEEEE